MYESPFPFVSFHHPSPYLRCPSPSLWHPLRVLTIPPNVTLLVTPVTGVCLLDIPSASMLISLHAGHHDISLSVIDVFLENLHTRKPRRWVWLGEQLSKLSVLANERLVATGEGENKQVASVDLGESGLVSLGVGPRLVERREVVDHLRGRWVIGESHGPEVSPSLSSEFARLVGVQREQLNEVSPLFSRRV
ncbi:hypothetical protein L202_03839 [Cryptococcus amylolentus CBS 6039]|uniref:Uncharacterized protein n=1 Tax=Cryptococcus amylolentus CBS 6039 TaxID=1295533 RepID=A0A1E3HW36_9TREE|nr:hypothetical protein L202_03839 [Cryptococcus amylolentus CBS 6039]ODN79966.1 hypothetical protein L202_03839 [Cryptococcus amylolentus CBS 6039]